MRRQTLFLLLILMLAAALRFYDLTYQSLWGDEAFSVYDAKGVDMHFMTASLVDATHSRFVNPHPGPLDTIVTCIRNEGTPPLYFLALAAWIVTFGSGDLAVRPLSAIFGVLGVAAFFLLGRSIFRDSHRALLGALFVAVSPLNIYFSQEARAYMLANLLATSCSWLLLRAVSRRPRVAPWVAYGLGPSGSGTPIISPPLSSAPTSSISSSTRGRASARGSSQCAAWACFCSRGISPPSEHKWLSRRGTPRRGPAPRGPFSWAPHAGSATS